MEKLTVTALLAVLGSCLTASEGQGKPCNDDKLLAEVNACYKANNVYSGLEKGKPDASSVIFDSQAREPTEKCSRKDDYNSAIRCALKALEKCFENVGLSGLLPDPDRMQKGLDMVCQRLKEFDSRCPIDDFWRMQQCGKNITRSVLADPSELKTDEDVICLSSDVHYDCAAYHLKSCGHLHLILKQLDEYHLPRACLNRRPGRPGRKIYIGNGNSLTPSPALFAAVVSLVFLTFHL